MIMSFDITILFAEPKHKFELYNEYQIAAKPKSRLSL